MGFFRTELWQHCDKCKFRSADAGQNYQKDAMLLLAPYIYSSSQMSAELQQVLYVMSRVDVTLVARNDSLNSIYGELLAQNKASSQFKHVSVRM